MRKFGLLVTVAAMIFASFSCENLEEQLKPSDKETSYTFTTKIREATRMADNRFEKGDAIGVYAYTDAGMTQACDENVLYIYDGAEFASVDAIEYVTGTELAFKAVYPVQLSGKEQFDFQIQTDQSNALSYSISDLMFSEVPLTDSKSPELVFDHKLAAVNLTFDSSVSMANAEVLVYAQSSVACDIAAGSFVGQDSVEQITPAQYGSNVYRVIVAPQSVAAGEVFALVSIGGEDHKLTLDSELVLKSGYEYTYTGKINESGDLVFSSQINPWGDGGSIDGTLVGDVAESPFEIKVFDIEHNQMKYVIMPSDDIEDYYVAFVSADYLNSGFGGDLMALVESNLAYYKEVGADFSASEEGILRNGDHEGSIKGFVELTDYYVCAVGVNANGETTSEVVGVDFTTPAMPSTDNQYLATVNSIGEESANLDILPLTIDNYFDFESNYIYACYEKSAASDKLWAERMGEGRVSFGQYTLNCFANNEVGLMQGMTSNVDSNLKPDTEYIYVIVGSDADYNINNRNVTFLEFKTLPEGTVRKDLPESYVFPADSVWHGQLEFFDYNERNDDRYGREIPAVGVYPSEWAQPYVLMYLPKEEYESMTESEIAARWMQEKWDFCYDEAGLNGAFSFNVIMGANLMSGYHDWMPLQYEDGVVKGEIKVIIFGMDNVTLQPNTPMTVVDFDCANPDYSVLTKAASPFGISRMGVPNVLQASIDSAIGFKAINMESRVISEVDLAEVVRKSNLRSIRK